MSVCDHYHSLSSHNTHCHTHTHTVHVFMTFSQMIRKVFAASTEHVPPSPRGEHKMSMSKHMAYCQAKHLMVCKMATVRQQRVRERKGGGH